MDHAPLRVTVWGENVQDQSDARVREIYPSGMHSTIAEGLREHLGGDAVIRTATLHQPEHGLSEAVLDETDVLTWWGHVAHDRVEERIVQRVHERVLSGMGLVVLHSGHASKIFKRLMGTGCMLRWREAGERELVWKVNPGHPVARGIPDVFAIPEQEMYGEYFDIPQPDELVFISSFTGGEVFRSGCAFHRGQGRIFYFSPGHEAHPVYHQREVRQVIANAVRWVGIRPTTPYATALKAVNVQMGWFEATTSAPTPRT